MAEDDIQRGFAFYPESFSRNPSFHTTQSDAVSLFDLLFFEETAYSGNVVTFTYISDVTPPQMATTRYLF